MIDLARARAEREGVRNAIFEQADAQIHPFADATYDIALSRTGAMFFGDASAAFANFARSLRRGGRLVLLVWQPFESNCSPAPGSPTSGAMPREADVLRR